ncbi:MAG: GrpB family protein [Patescibacteria group bacterium]|nr:GrpB family protein [Patescibacteria group bacterium]
MTRNYSVEKYTANWQRRFRIQEKLIKRVLGKAALEIHHVGSTSVKGMSAKPIVDMLVIVKEFHALDRAKTKFEKLGYVFRSNYVKPNSRLLEKFRGETKLYNIHFFKKNHEHVPRILNIRDYLRAHPETVKAYEALKQKLLNKYPNDYRSYSHGKHEFLDALAERAKKWARDN